MNPLLRRAVVAAEGFEELQRATLRAAFGGNPTAPDTLCVQPERTPASL